MGRRRLTRRADEQPNLGAAERADPEQAPRTERDVRFATVIGANLRDPRPQRRTRGIDDLDDIADSGADRRRARAIETHVRHRPGVEAGVLVEADANTGGELRSSAVGRRRRIDAALREDDTIDVTRGRGRDEALGVVACDRLAIALERIAVPAAT